jgi:hypothetical protein
MATTLVISDLHAPFQHPDAVDFLADLWRTYKPHRVVCIGDEIDAHGWSRHDRNPDAPGQGCELNAAKLVLRRVFKLFPKVRVCNSNHTQRAFRKAVRAGLPSAYIRATREVLEAPKGWEWADSWTDEDGIRFIHGEGYSGRDSALKAALANRCSTVIGHVHSWAGVAYHCNGEDTIFGMNVGCLVDPRSLAMEYAATSANRQTLGTGLIIDGVPTFIPLKG